MPAGPVKDVKRKKDGEQPQKKEQDGHKESQEGMKRGEQITSVSFKKGTPAFPKGRKKGIVQGHSVDT